MNILKSFCQKLWQGFKKGLLRLGKRTLDVAFQLMLVAAALIGMALAEPWGLIIWAVVATIINVVVIIVLGLKIDPLLLYLIQFFITVFIVHFIARRRSVWKDGAARPFSSGFFSRHS